MEYAKLKKSDRVYIRNQKAKIRRQFWDVAKQEEMITAIYERLLPSPKIVEGGESKPVKVEQKKEVKKEEAPKAKAKKEKKVKAPK
mgnify:CR=1 FL=1